MGAPTCSTFAEHKEQTAKDLEALIEMLTELAAEVREGNMKKWEEFWWSGGTEEGDAQINQLRELLVFRYAYREESLESNIPPLASADTQTTPKETAL